MMKLVHGWLAEAAARDPGGDLILWSDGGVQTTGELWDQANSFARGLIGTGIEGGSRVVIMADNCPEFLVAWFGSSIAGMVCVPINASMRGNILKHMLDLASPEVVVSDVDSMALVRDQCGSDYIAIEIGDSDTTYAHPSSKDIDSDVAQTSAISFAAFLDTSSAQRLPDDLESTDVCALMFTSGTTGASKAVIWTHEMANQFAISTQQVLAYNEDDVAFTALPLFHANALCVTLQAAGMAGAKIAISRRFSVSGFWSEAISVGATATSLLGSMVSLLWSQHSTSSESNHSINRALVVPYPTPIATDFSERFGLSLTTLYGLTDVGLPIGIPHELDTVPSSTCGRALADWEVRIFDDDDRTVDSGVVGELVVRPQLPWMSFVGYWKDQHASFEAVRNFWFHTGDYASIDADGWVYFADRKKDYIRKSGENVSAYEVELVLLDVPGIEDAAVIGVPSDLGEDDVMAVIVVEGGLAIDFDELEQYCFDKLPYFAVPRYYRIVESLPRTETQKVRKASLRDEGLTDHTVDRGPVSRRKFEATEVAAD